MAKVGDTVRKTISCSVTSRQMGAITPEELIEYTGKVIYVHPKGRYYTAEFDFPDGKIRETYKD